MSSLRADKAFVHDLFNQEFCTSDSSSTLLVLNIFVENPNEDLTLNVNRRTRAKKRNETNGNPIRAVNASRVIIRRIDITQKTRFTFITACGHGGINIEFNRTFHNFPRYRTEKKNNKNTVPQSHDNYSHCVFLYTRILLILFVLSDIYLLLTKYPLREYVTRKQKKYKITFAKRWKTRLKKKIIIIIRQNYREKNLLPLKFFATRIVFLYEDGSKKKKEGKCKCDRIPLVKCSIFIFRLTE